MVCAGSESLPPRCVIGCRVLITSAAAATVAAESEVAKEGKARVVGGARMSERVSERARGGSIRK